jgi:hypothetical protein
LHGPTSTLTFRREIIGDTKKRGNKSVIASSMNPRGFDPKGGEFFAFSLAASQILLTNGRSNHPR